MFDNDANYASTRIAGTYMMPRKTELGLHFVVDIAGGPDLSKAKIVAVDLKGERKNVDCDFFRFTLGSFGWLSSGVFATRMPIRRDWKQGLRYSQIILHKDENRIEGIGEGTFKNLLPQISDSLQGKYSTYEDVLDKVEEENRTVPFSRTFAFDNAYRLVYKGYKVGRLGVNDKPVLETNFSFLEQELNQEMERSAK